MRNDLPILSLEPERCPVCGASVRKENLRSHYEKVHPRKVASLAQPKTLTVASSGSVFRSHRRRNILVLSIVVLVVIGVSFAAATYDRGIHWHPVLSITSNTSGAVTVPMNIGIDQSLWKDHSLDQYGEGGLSPMHTHDTSGTIHVEANTSHHDFTLHEFLAIWGQPSDGSAINGKAVVSLTIDGQAQASPTQDFVLKDKQQIRMVTA
ncbi:hypothetical protein E6H20_04580 [Candidatus Bathyarchaeota archaeon]|nr:MAG: hypothetical protein E6H20_04580 [Candidatus Bathyarchaeota archaeon]